MILRLLPRTKSESHIRTRRFKEFDFRAFISSGSISFGIVNYCYFIWNNWEKKRKFQTLNLKI